MIALASDTADRIDEAVEASLAALAARAALRAPHLDELVTAARRAASGGKRFRPALTIAAFDAFGGTRDDTPELWPVAAAFELLHTAFVIHDDLIDRDLERRGAPNVGGEFRQRGLDRGATAQAAAELGDAAAVLAGDLLLAEAVRLVAMAPTDPDRRDSLLGILDEAVLVSAAGELADVEHAVAQRPSPAAQLVATAHDKTAVYSFAAPLAAGAVMAGADDSDRAIAVSAVSSIGLAFQLVDDLIGTFGTRTQAGRAPGADLRARKQTALIAFARASAQQASVDEALERAPTGPVAVRRAQRVLQHSGARDRLVGLVGELLRDARTAASGLPVAPRDLIHALADRVQERIP